MKNVNLIQSNMLTSIILEPSYFFNAHTELFAEKKTIRWLLKKHVIPQDNSLIILMGLNLVCFESGPSKKTNSKRKQPEYSQDGLLSS